MWKREQERPYFTQNLSQEQIKAVSLVLEDMDYFRKLLPSLCLEPMKTAEVKRYAEAFLNALKKKLEQRGTVYLPLGYRHGISNEGHVIVD